MEVFNLVPSNNNIRHVNSHDLNEIGNDRVKKFRQLLPKLSCYCFNHCPKQGELEGVCEVEHGGSCFTVVEETFNTDTGLFEPEYGYGCLSSGDPGFLQCKGDLVDHNIPISIACCDHENLCNEQLRPMYKPSNISDYATNNPPSEYFLLQLLLLAVVSLLVLTFFVILYIVCKYREKEKKQSESDSNKSCLITPPIPIKDRYLDFDQSSGSGAGMPLLVQSTIGKQITFRQKIGKGRYGEVYLGEWKGTYVAVKSVSTTEEAAWWREQAIYKMALIKHPNILVSMGWDIRSCDGVTQMIIVTDYHPRGSLYDYLQSHSIKEDEAYKLVYSAIAGLCHLHSEVEGKPYKPGIAHRDLKSKNILVKNNGETCIADFGLAVCSVSGQKGVDVKPNPSSGTRRYMAPEILDNSIKQDWFEAYKQSDMYSMALIFWEIGRRCLTPVDTEKVESEEYAVPYEDTVPSDPTIEDMRKVVCEMGIRPDIPLRWNKSKFLMELQKLIIECWHRSPQVRLTSLRVKKTLVDYHVRNSFKKFDNFEDNLSWKTSQHIV